MLWTREKERRARYHATSAQHDITRGKINRKTTVKMYGYHPEGYESKWYGEGRCRETEKVAKRISTGHMLKIWPTEGQNNVSDIFSD